MKVSNSQIKQILEKTVNLNRKDWSLKLAEMPYGHFELLLKLILECLRIDLFLKKQAIYW